MSTTAAIVLSSTPQGTLLVTSAWSSLTSATIVLLVVLGLAFRTNSARPGPTCFAG